MPNFHRAAYAQLMTMTPEELEERTETLEVLNSELASRLARQSDSLAKIDTKAVFVIGFAVTAAQFLATHKHQPVLAALAFAAYAVALAAGALTVRVADHEDLEPREMLETYARSPKAQALVSLAASRVDIYEKNHKRHNRKALFWSVSLWSAAVGLLFSTAALVLHT